MVTEEMIRRLPKVELHDHLDGGLRPATIIELESLEDRAQDGIVYKEPNEEFTEKKQRERLSRLSRQERQLLGLKKVLEGLADEEATINMTDPEAPVMKHKDGRKLPSYNHQSATDGKYGVVCAVATRDEVDKSADLFELVDQARENTGEWHQRVMADPAFCDYEVLQKAAEERSEEYFLPDKRFEHTEGNKEGRGAYDNSRFQRQEDGSLICPEGKPMRLGHVERFDDGHTESRYEGTACEGCPVQDKCTTAERRTVGIDSRQPFREAMREKLRGDRGRETYMKRQGIAEPLHGDDQKNRGWKQHHLRGLSKASLEFVLIRIATNLGKIVRYRAAAIMALSP